MGVGKSAGSIGDFLGFGCADEHPLSAEAVSKTKVLAIKKSALAAAASRDPAIERQVLLLMARELACLQERTLLLIEKCAGTCLRIYS